MSDECSGQQLLLISAAVALELSKCLSECEIDRLSAFLMVLSDQLALITVAGCSEEVPEAEELVR